MKLAKASYTNKNFIYLTINIGLGKIKQSKKSQIFRKNFNQQISFRIQKKFI